MPKPRLFVELGQRIGAGVVIDPEVRFPRPNSNRMERGARMLCDCGDEYTKAMSCLVGSRPDAMSCGCQRGKWNGHLIDRTNQRYGKLTVIKLAGLKPKSRWLCLCDCGNEAVVLSVCLRKGWTSSCGCVGRGPRLPPGVAARNQVLKDYKRGARIRSLTWELSADDFDCLISQDCFYCGSSPSNLAAGTFAYNGIDRMDSGLGYTRENAVTCCRICNRAKSDLPYDEFMAWVSRLTAHARVRSSSSGPA